MSTVDSKTQYTPDDLLTIPDGDRYELVDGQLVEKDMGWKSSWVGTRVCHLIELFLADQPLGWAVVEGSYQCFPEAPNKVRKPDVSFVRRGRLPNEEPPKGHCPIAPDLVVLVVSPHDLFYRVEEQVQEYLTAGVLLVWVINPESQTVHIYRPKQPGSIQVQGDDELTGEDVLPGFGCKVGEIFRPPIS